MADETLSMSELQFNFFLETMLQKGDKCPHCHGKPEVEECIWCGVRDCPHNEPLHYHHDGCPACIKDDHKEGQVGDYCFVCGGLNKAGCLPNIHSKTSGYYTHEFVPCVRQSDFLSKAAEAAQLKRENEKLKAELKEAKEHIINDMQKSLAKLELKFDSLDYGTIDDITPEKLSKLKELVGK